LADLSGRLLIEHHEPADVTRGAETTTRRIIELFEWVLGEYPVPGNAWALSLALPGYVGSPGGHVADVVNLNLVPGWAGYDVRTLLGGRFNAPVFIGNEVHLMALGELRAGHGVGRSDLLFVKVGTGISAGLCSDGRIHTGWMGFAGDIGHVAPPDAPSIACRCGYRGCLEAIAAGPAIAREASHAAAAGKSPYLARLLASGTPITAAHVGAGADDGDAYCTGSLVRSGNLVGAALATLVAGYNPSIVVMGGGVAQSGAVFVEAVRDGVFRRSRSLTTEKLAIVQSELGKTAGLIGGASAALDKLFERDYLASWIIDGHPPGHQPRLGVDGSQISRVTVLATPPPVPHADGSRDTGQDNPMAPGEGEVALRP
jgi:predicted NBD/HSP70 family sugar kinase